MEVFYTDSFIPDYNIGEKLLDRKICLRGKLFAKTTSVAGFCLSFMT
jgi:hypothetical protein